MKTKTMTAAEFIETIDNPIVWYVSVAQPGGNTVAWLDETELGFDLAEVEGVVEDDEFVATNLTHGDGAHDWSFTDCSTSYVLNIKIYSDRDEWEEQAMDYLLDNVDEKTLWRATEDYGISEQYAKSRLAETLSFDDVLDAEHPGEMMENYGVGVIDNGIFRLENYSEEDEPDSILVGPASGFVEIYSEWDEGCEFHQEIPDNFQDIDDIIKAADDCAIALHSCTCGGMTCYCVSAEDLEDLVEYMKNQ